MVAFKEVLDRLSRRIGFGQLPKLAGPHEIRSKINPNDVIGRLTVEDLSLAADNYFSSIVDTTHVLSKPFSDLIETPQILENMGILLSGLRLGKTMTVLEFGAGTCWFSRYLTQLQCRTISCDVSKTALEIGRRLFEEFPIVGVPISEPVFLHFDGHKISLPNDSVDRIICHDALHHVPNQKEVISELGRVLKTGGIAGFSEPGRFHSQSPQSQSEMRNFNVLENDIVPTEIFSIARQCGFDDMRLKLLCDMEISLSQYESLTNRIPRLNSIRLVHNNVKRVMSDRTVFFLYKGKFVSDSRSHLGLSHSISLDKTEFQIRVGEYLNLPVKITNTGSARWIVKNVNDIGVVKIGTRLYDKDDKLLNLDFSRHCFTNPIEPDETVDKTIAIKFSDVGLYKLSIDLVSERICWFENIGSKPQFVTVNVQR